MSLLGRVSKMMGNINEAGLAAASVVGKVANKILSKSPGLIEKGAGAANKGIELGKAAVGKIRDGSLLKATTKGVGKVSRNVLSDDSSYKVLKIGNKETNIAFSKKPLFMDDLNRRGKQAVDNMAAIFDTISKDDVVVNGTKVRNPLQLIRKDENSLIGYKATKKGVLLAGTGAMIMGTPGAAKQFVEDRKGLNPDGQVTTSAPSVPAYAQNAGATGDLVFALNNLRHGGMM